MNDQPPTEQFKIVTPGRVLHGLGVRWLLAESHRRNDVGAEIYRQFPSLLATIVLSTIAAIIVMAVLIRVLPDAPGSGPE